MVNETLETDRAYQKAISEVKRQANKSSDCISRKQAIDVFDKRLDVFMVTGDKYELVKYRGDLYQMPPAQPEQRWIPCKERLPDEEDSIFARYYGTDRWRKSMFRKKSREVIVTSVFEDGELHTEVAHTTDGEWHIGVNVVPRTVIAWMPLPEPYQPDAK